MAGDLTIAIPTYGREEVLVQTLDAVLALGGATELILVDQTPAHTAGVESRLGDLSTRQQVRWLGLPEPDLVGAMNLVLCEDAGSVVLF